MSNINNRKHEYRDSPERKQQREERAKRQTEAQVKQYMEQQAADFERTLAEQGQLVFLKFMSARGIEMLAGMCEEELLRRRNEQAPKKPSGLLDARGNQL